jgi:hypothetical protein
MEPATDHVLSPMAAELCAMLRMEGERLDLEPENLEAWMGSIRRRSDFDPDALAVEVVALGLKIRRLAAEAGAAAIAQLDEIAQMLMARIDPERQAALHLTIQEELGRTTGETLVRRAPVHDQPAPTGTFTLKDLGPRLERPRPGRRPARK